MKVSNSIYKYSKIYKVDSMLLTAIFAQESGYVTGAKNCIKGYDKKALDERRIEIREICVDFGIAQINYRNVGKLKLDVFKMLEDLDYTVEQGAKILKNFQNKYSSKDISWWSRYNAKSKIKRELYKKLVERYL